MNYERIIRVTHDDGWGVLIEESERGAGWLRISYYDEEHPANESVIDISHEMRKGLIRALMEWR